MIHLREPFTVFGAFLIVCPTRLAPIVAHPGDLSRGPLFCPNWLSRKTPSISHRLSPCVHWSVTTPKRVPKNRCFWVRLAVVSAPRYDAAGARIGRQAVNGTLMFREIKSPVACRRSLHLVVHLCCRHLFGSLVPERDQGPFEAVKILAYLGPPGTPACIQCLTRLAKGARPGK